ncbi:MAG: hypothetical protein EOS07_35185 [Mesorhizobium sp.]|nr:MAG: hypothetical protein EOS07_35185 [Mesorhizobium sp.]
MIPTHVIPYRHGELRIGWASWDDGTYTDRSIKWAYRDGSGKISRGSPEIPFDILLDMIDLATSQGELTPHVKPAPKVPKDVAQATKPELVDERKVLAARLATLQVMIAEVPWAEWQPIYDQLGARYDAVVAELALRS